jgi:CO/xanthine dehydrogenase Mo-binding subunit
VTIATPTRRATPGIGESAMRPDAAPKARGSFAYASDLHIDGMLYGQTIRGTVAHARIPRIDLSAATAVSGVHAALTAADLPTAERFGLMRADQPVLAGERVRYVGEPLALIAAETPEQARRAAAAVTVEYESLEPVFDPVAALRPGAPIVHEAGNVIDQILLIHGDPDTEADVVVGGEYEVAAQDQVPLGPEACLAVPDPDGGVTLHVATQWLHEDLDQVVRCVGLPRDKVRARLSGVGGAFGAREDLSAQVHACALALRTRRPVRMSYGREESFYGHVHRHPARLFFEHGATRQGRLVYVRATIVLDGGAYTSSSPAVVATAACFATGPYRVPNVKVRCVAAHTNNPPSGAMRGFGAVQSCFAYESQMDKLALRLGMDRVAIRRLNGLREGDELATGQPLRHSASVAELLDRCVAIPMPSPAEAPSASRQGAAGTALEHDVVRGIGYAVGIKNVAYAFGSDDYSTASVRVARDADGIVAHVRTAAAEVGQGIATICMQIVRTELGIERVRIDAPDSSMDSAGSSSASRQTWMTGGAVRAACREVRAELDRRLGDGRPMDDDEGIPADLLAEPIERTVTYRHRPTEKRSPGMQQDGHVAFLLAAHRAVVDVDRRTGLVRVVQIATAQDVGRALNPLAVVGQIEGGIAQGLGLAVLEEIRIVDGTIRNPSLTDYLLPTIVDMPPVLVDLVEHPHPDAPYGAKGVGEPPTISSTAAIVSALRAATGRALDRVPVRPDDIVFERGGVVDRRVVPGDDPGRTDGAGSPRGAAPR